MESKYNEMIVDHAKLNLESSDKLNQVYNK